MQSGIALFIEIIGLQTINLNKGCINYERLIQEQGDTSTISISRDNRY